MIGYFGLFAFVNPLFTIRMIILNYLSVDVSNLLSLLLKALSIYYAYGKARVI